MAKRKAGRREGRTGLARRSPARQREFPYSVATWLDNVSPAPPRSLEQVVEKVFPQLPPSVVRWLDDISTRWANNVVSAPPASLRPASRAVSLGSGSPWENPSVTRWLDKIDADLEQSAVQMWRQLGPRLAVEVEEAITELLPLVDDFDDLPENERIILKKEMRHYAAACKAGFWLAVVNLPGFLRGDFDVTRLLETTVVTKEGGDCGRGSQTKRSNWRREEAWRLTKQGKTAKQIAKELGLSETNGHKTVYKLLKKPKSQRG
jgi:hypothetical protein